MYLIIYFYFGIKAGSPTLYIIFRIETRYLANHGISNLWRTEKQEIDYYEKLARYLMMIIWLLTLHLVT